jgi:hypothetical protein
MKNLLLTLIILSILICSCEKEKNIANNGLYEGLVIKYGTTCGWCGGTDSLIISENITVYKYYSMCYDNEYQKSEITGKDDWNDLLVSFDLEDFLDININTCYYCADGCDDWIYIQNNTVSHQIRYGLRDSLKIQPISPFVDKLESLRLKFKNQSTESCQ